MTHSSGAPSSSTTPPGADRLPSRGFAVCSAILLLSASIGVGCLGLEKPGGSDGAADGGADGGSADMNASDGGDRSGDRQGPTRNETPWTGAWLGTWPSGENGAISDFNRKTDHRVKVVDLLLSWNTSYSDLDPTLTHIAAAGARPLITWNPVNLTTSQIADGSTEIHVSENETMTVDEYVRSFAKGICGYADHTGKTVLLEPMPEPNGDWHSWSIGYETPGGEQPNTNQSYKQAWSHVREVFTKECPDGAKFVWTINGANRGNGTSYMGTFPGDDGAERVGIRGINLGQFQQRGWASFGATYGHAYCNVTQQTDLGVVVTAVASVEEGGDKGRWIREAYRNASSHAWHQIEGLVWYHDELTLGSGETVDLTVDSSSGSLEAYKEAVGRIGSESIPDGESPPC